MPGELYGGRGKRRAAGDFAGLQTCLGLNDFNPAVRGFHIEGIAKNVVDLAAAFPTVRNLCFVPGEYMFQKKLLPASLEWGMAVEATRIVGEHAARADCAVR